MTGLYTVLSIQRVCAQRLMIPHLVLTLQLSYNNKQLHCICISSFCKISVFLFLLFKLFYIYLFFNKGVHFVSAALCYARLFSHTNQFYKYQRRSGRHRLYIIGLLCKAAIPKMSDLEPMFPCDNHGQKGRITHQCPTTLTVLSALYMVDNILFKESCLLFTITCTKSP